MALKRILRPGAGDWILLSADPAMLKTPALAAVPDGRMLDRPAVHWTDQYSNLLGVVNWKLALMQR